MFNKSKTQCKYLLIRDDNVAVCRIREEDPEGDFIPRREYNYWKKACTIFPANEDDFKGLTKCTYYWEPEPVGDDS